MVLGGKTISFVQGNTHEGMKWTIVDQKKGFVIDITGATLNVLVQSVDTSITIIDRVATIIDPMLGTSRLIPIAGEMDIPGNYKVQLHIVFSDLTEIYIQNMYVIIISALS